MLELFVVAVYDYTMHGAWGPPMIGSSIQWLRPEPYLLEHVPEGGGFFGKEADSSVETYGEAYSLISDKTKLVIRVSRTFFHMLLDTCAVVLDKLAENPDLHVVLLSPPVDRNLDLGNTQMVLDEFVRTLSEDNGVEVTVLNPNSDQRFLINNFFLLNDAAGSLSSTERVIELFGVEKRVARQEQRLKVYLSRRKTVSNQNLPLDLGINIESKDFRKQYEYKTNDRIDDEKLLEDYFFSLGFTVICPEDFENFSDQLDFFATAKCIVSVTSASLTNSIFMRPGGVLVELITPLVTPTGPDSEIRSVHPMYQMLATLKNHTYVGIPHERIAANLVHKIEQSPPLRAMLASL